MHTSIETTYVLLRLDKATYVLNGAYVREVTRWRAPTMVPGAPALMPGIINHRGVIMPVVDMRLLMHMAESPPDRATRYMMIHLDDIEAAFLVDSVIDLINLSDTTVEPLPTAIDPQRSRFLKGVIRIAQEPLGLLDLPAIMESLLSKA
ncbi:MAG: chemotaxis protein CheW [Chloroflexaceae bacterium]|nr:chemotaxis protein CheW [Chloroflexaceae bacterium]